MANKEFKNSLKNQMLTMTLIPLTLMTVAIVVVSISIVRKSITDHIQEELIHDAELVGFVFDEFYAGDYRIEKGDTDEDVKIYKGEQLLNGDDTLMGKFSSVLNIDVSVFYNDTRLLTTLVDDSGKSAMGTQAAAVVKRDVLEGNQSAFYDNVMVYERKSFAYYSPLLDSNGEVVGMIAVARSAEDVQEQVVEYVFPIVIICIFVAVFFGIIMVRFNRKLAGRIQRMGKYMNRLANGEFDSEMPRELLLEDDEIKGLANDGKRMSRSLKMLVEYDALTELNNRRSADKRLADIRMKSVELGMKFCVCIADIDFFKKVNDTYGHEMGDEVLRMVAEKLKSGMVGKGFVARWGGEEFLLIFDNREIGIAYRELCMIMEEIRTIYVPETGRQITMSFGLTVYETGEDVDTALSRADANLYKAKENGRNQIVAG